MQGLLGALLGLSFPVGIFVSQGVFRVRAGVTKRRTGVDWREFLFPNLGFFFLVVLKSVVWPVVFLIWLCMGMPPSRWRAITLDAGIEQRKIIRIPAANRELSEVIAPQAGNHSSVTSQPLDPILAEIYAGPESGGRRRAERGEAALRDATPYIWRICSESGQSPLAVFYGEGSDLVPGGLLVVTSSEALHFYRGQLRRISHRPNAQTSISGSRNDRSAYLEVTVNGAEGTISYAAESLEHAQRICGVIDFWVENPGMRNDPRVLITPRRVEIPDEFYVDTLRMAGHPITVANMQSIHERFGMLFITKARKYIDSVHGVAAGEQFTERYGRPGDHLLPIWPASVLRGWIELDSSAAYIAACVPHQTKSFLLEMAASGGYMSNRNGSLSMWHGSSYRDRDYEARREMGPGQPPVGL